MDMNYSSQPPSLLHDMSGANLSHHFACLQVDSQVKPNVFGTGGQNCDPFLPNDNYPYRTLQHSQTPQMTQSGNPLPAVTPSPLLDFYSIPYNEVEPGIYDSPLRDQGINFDFSHQLNRGQVTRNVPDQLLTSTNRAQAEYPIEH